MLWQAWKGKFIDHCWSRGLQPMTVETYSRVLDKFEEYVKKRLSSKDPNLVTFEDICTYIGYSREARGHGCATVNQTLVIIKQFYQCAVSYNLLTPNENPMRRPLKIKKPHEVAGDVLSLNEINSLTSAPDPRTVVGIRDRAVLLLLCTTGIRASECAEVRVKDIDLINRQLRVLGKGGNERRVNLKNEVVEAIKNYLECLSTPKKETYLFRVRTGKHLNRWRIYERVRFYLKKARIFKNISPHRLRHSFATEMIKSGTDLHVLRELLGHRSISSTIRYVKISAEKIRAAIEKLPINDTFEKMLAQFPLQKRRYQRAVGNTS